MGRSILVHPSCTRKKALALTPPPPAAAARPEEQMHRSMCPADVLAPEAARLHEIMLSLDQQLEAEVGDKTTYLPA